MRIFVSGRCFLPGQGVATSNWKWSEVTSRFCWTDAEAFLAQSFSEAKIRSSTFPQVFVSLSISVIKERFLN